jgi:DNA-binding MarR family transcriptional regulator
MFSAEDSDHARAIKAYIRSHLKTLLGLEDTSGVELASMVHALARLYDFVETQSSCGSELSGSRWALLLHLMIQGKVGEREGLTPTSLSRFQGVSKNTTSALLRGLEEQGYIQRALDPDDYRVFRIQLTAAGQELIASVAPERFAYVNQLAAGLSCEEREQLTSLLEKLYHSIRANANVTPGQLRDV